MSELNGKNVVVTGGTSGIGLATARLLQERGARVLVTGRNPQVQAEARAVLGADAVVVGSDTSRLDDIDALASTAKAHFGEIDLLFVNAGIAKFLPFDQVSESFWEETLNVNLKGAFFTVQRLAPLIRSGGAIVLNTSVVDERGMPGTSTYAVSKAGLRSLARTLASELLPRGIRVNAVSPGPISTPIYGKLGFPAEVADAWATQMRETNPMKRFGHADEVARAVAFLGFDATFTTGEEIVVDGGLNRL